MSEKLSFGQIELSFDEIMNWVLENPYWCLGKSANFSFEMSEFDILITLVVKILKNQRVDSVYMKKLIEYLS